uniref:Uncharacterized protein n=1 Tax=Chromera velia CCMP2878 TaxID=1169474 RepID=A0A0G4FYW0_9ALVE|eukprot:Cvel_19459.t1-p1 / transcript=Cvel_19459.t1 / gene=Cvel_19459 / organism=Chromera_velia_CCMP2878 / gene_product=hypothetical protein / transcript_product=hypothetical protein / location=Cvel_scaffold1679:12091-13738(-) / protein_length=218 / sequence_SO=supercontig / SO=protein_coding / is_pseudo=false
MDAKSDTCLSSLNGWVDEMHSKKRKLGGFCSCELGPTSKRAEEYEENMRAFRDLQKEKPDVAVVLRKQLHALYDTTRELRQLDAERQRVDVLEHHPGCVESRRDLDTHLEEFDHRIPQGLPKPMECSSKPDESHDQKEHDGGESDLAPCAETRSRHPYVDGREYSESEMLHKAEAMCELEALAAEMGRSSDWTREEFRRRWNLPTIDQVDRVLRKYRR